MAPYPYRCPGICRMRSIFPASTCNAIHIAQIKQQSSNLDAVHCTLMLKPCCIWTNISGKAKSSLDLGHQPWPECARPPSSHPQPRNSACPCCQETHPSLNWSHCRALGKSRGFRQNCSLVAECEGHWFLLIWLCFIQYLSCYYFYSCGFDSYIRLLGNCIRMCFYSAVAEGERRDKSGGGKW